MDTNFGSEESFAVRGDKNNFTATISKKSNEEMEEGKIVWFEN